MTGPGRPPIGPKRSVRVPDEIWRHLVTEARRQGVPEAEMVRHILAERYNPRLRHRARRAGGSQ